MTMEDKNNHRKLFRSDTDRIFAGVCGGLGEYFEIDSTIIRIIFILLAFGGVGILLYIILMFIMPTRRMASSGNMKDDIKNNAEKVAEDVKAAAKDWKEAYHHGAHHHHEWHGDGRMWVGVILLVFGVLFLLENLSIFSWLNFGHLWPIILIIFGFLIISRRHHGE